MAQKEKLSRPETGQWQRGNLGDSLKSVEIHDSALERVTPVKVRPWRAFETEPWRANHQGAWGGNKRGRVGIAVPSLRPSAGRARGSNTEQSSPRGRSI